MLLKLFYALLILGAVAMVVHSRLRGGENRGGGRAARATPVPARLVAYGVAVVIIVTSAAAGLFQWVQGSEAVAVRVINGDTGQETAYTVERGSISGRRFRTVDGRTIVLAETERLEVLD